MPLRTVVLLIVFAAVALFAALNWSAFLAPTTISLGVAQVQAPLGLIMLGLTAVLTTLFLASAEIGEMRGYMRERLER